MGAAPAAKAWTSSMAGSSRPCSTPRQRLCWTPETARRGPPWTCASITCAPYRLVPAGWKRPSSGPGVESPGPPRRSMTAHRGCARPPPAHSSGDRGTLCRHHRQALAVELADGADRQLIDHHDASRVSEGRAVFQAELLDLLWVHRCCWLADDEGHRDLPFCRVR